MSIAHKLVTIADNMKKVSDAGYSAGYIEGETDGYDIGYHNGQFDGFHDGYNHGWITGHWEGTEEGKQQENELFWQRFWAGLKNPDGDNYNLRSAFAGGGWNNETFSKMIYPSEKIVIKGLTPGQNTFYYFNRSYSGNSSAIDMSEFCSRIDTSGITNATYMFYNANVKNVTVDLGNCTTIQYAFSCDNGGRIDNLTLKVTNVCTSFLNTFSYMYPIKEIRFTEDSEITANVSFVHSDKLTDESIQSIIDALGVVTSTKKITFHSAIVDRLTDEQSQQIVNKGWQIG